MQIISNYSYVDADLVGGKETAKTLGSIATGRSGGVLFFPRQGEWFTVSSPGVVRGGSGQDWTEKDVPVQPGDRVRLNRRGNPENPAAWSIASRGEQASAVAAEILRSQGIAV